MQSLLICFFDCDLKKEYEKYSFNELQRQMKYDYCRIISKMSYYAAEM